MPRCFWQVELQPSELGFDEATPPLISSERSQAEAKPAYRGCVIQGPVERQFLYATLLPVDMMPFGYLRLRPVVLPLLIKDGAFVLQDVDRARRAGYLHLAEWLEKVETEWRARRGEHVRLSAIQWLDYRRKLTVQRPLAQWDVKDATPWANGADAPEFMYARGDTVDLQLGTDPTAPTDRKEAVLGDLRVSIGPFQGKPTAVVYRKVAGDKHPKAFSSGVVKGYEMESVVVLTDAVGGASLPRVEVKVDAVNRRTIVEAALPMAALGVTPKGGTTLRADFGVTFGNKAGNDTALRTYWSNQATGLVSDEVFELKMEPANWGTLELTE